MKSLDDAKNLQIPVATEPPPVRVRKPLSEKRKAWLARSRERSGFELPFLLGRKLSKKPITLHTIGAVAKERLRGFGPYLLHIGGGPDGEPQTIRKLDVLCMGLPGHYNHFRKRFEVDEKVKEQNLFPAENPSERYPVPEELMAEGQSVRVTLLDGTVTTGQVARSTFYIFELTIPGWEEGKLASLLVFKHGLYSLQECGAP